MATADELNIWQDDDNRVFRFEEVERYFKESSIEEIFTAFNDESVDNFNGLRLVTIDGAFPSERIFITPDNKAFTFCVSEPVSAYENFNGAGKAELDLIASPELLKWVFLPVYNLGGEIFESVPADLWKVRWEGIDSEDFETIRFPLKSSLFDKFDSGLTCIDEYTEEPENLIVYTELKVDNRLVYVAGGNVSSFAWFADKELPERISKASHEDEEPRTYLEFLNTFEDEENQYTSAYYVPVEKLPESILSCQDPMIPPAGMKPVAHFPVDIRRGDRVPYGDMGTTTVFWDGENCFEVEYSQS